MVRCPAIVKGAVGALAIDDTPLRVLGGVSQPGTAQDVALAFGLRHPGLSMVMRNIILLARGPVELTRSTLDCMTTLPMRLSGAAAALIDWVSGARRGKGAYLSQGTLRRNGPMPGKLFCWLMVRGETLLLTKLIGGLCITLSRRARRWRMPLALACCRRADELLGHGAMAGRSHGTCRNRVVSVHPGERRGISGAGPIGRNKRQSLPKTSLSELRFSGELPNKITRNPAKPVLRSLS